MALSGCRFNLVDFNVYDAEINLKDDLGRDDSSYQITSLCISCDKEIQLPYKWLWIK